MHGFYQILSLNNLICCVLRFLFMGKMCGGTRSLEPWGDSRCWLCLFSPGRPGWALSPPSRGGGGAVGQADSSRDRASFQHPFSNHAPPVLHPRKRCGLEPFRQLRGGFGGICKGFFGGGALGGVLGPRPTSRLDCIERTGWESEG